MFVCSDFQNMPGGVRPSAPRPQAFNTVRPASQVPRMMSTQRVGQLPLPSISFSIQVICFTTALFINVSVFLLAGPQNMGPRQVTAVPPAAAPVRGVHQYKYATGVRNPQQHMAAQAQVAMQQVRMHFSMLWQSS